MQHDGLVTIRDMKPGEEKMLVGAARKAFIHSPLEQLVISSPRSALVAEVEGCLAGAMFLRIIGKGEKKTGYLDIGFVVKEYRGRGIARILYPAAMEYLQKAGCGLIAAMVIDDNSASWKTLENQGFGKPSLTGLVRSMGLGRAVEFWFKTLMCIACGTHLWAKGLTKERRSPHELAVFLGVNVLLILPGFFLHGRSDVFLFVLAYLSVLLAGVLFGGLGCLAAGGKWYFAFPRCGTLLTLFMNSIGGVFPMTGRWYPRNPQNTKECRRTMGIQAVVEWMGMILIFALGAFLLKDNLFLYRCATIAASLLVYRVILILPFGGGRVWNWSKLVFAALAAVTIILFMLL